MRAYDLYNLTTNFKGYRNIYEVDYFDVLENNITGAYCDIGSQQASKYRKVFYFCFKGTEIAVNDILTDLLFVKSVVPYSGTNPQIKVHSGFLNQYLSIRLKFLETIRNIFNSADCLDVFSFVFVGHSLGAALSTLAILDFQYNFPEDSQSNIFNFFGAGFGSPKVGNKSFVESFNKRINDFKNYQIETDLVPMLPWGDYYHVNKVIRLSSSKNNWKLFSIKDHLKYGKYLEERNEPAGIL
jgi:triacylglycerol lipase